MVAVAHPHIQQVGAIVVRQTGKQCIRADHLDLGMAKFALVSRFGGTAELGRHGLHAVADAQHRQAAVEHFGRGGRATGLGGAFRATGQDDALGTEGGDLGRVVVPGPDLAVHTELADAAGNQLGVLRAEVEDEELVVVDVGHWREVSR